VAATGADNLIWTLVQDLSWRLFELGNPAHTLTAIDTVIYRDSDAPAQPDYFAHESELTLSSGLAYSLWANLDAGDAISAALRATGGVARSGLGPRQAGSLGAAGRR